MAISPEAISPVQGLEIYVTLRTFLKNYSIAGLPWALNFTLESGRTTFHSRTGRSIFFFFNSTLYFVHIWKLKLRAVRWLACRCPTWLLWEQKWKARVPDAWLIITGQAMPMRGEVQFRLSVTLRTWTTVSILVETANQDNLIILKGT